MDIVKLVLIFLIVMVLINRKMPLAGALAIGSVLGCLFYTLGLRNSIQVILGGIFNETTITVLVITYVITFLQRMLEKRDDLMKAQNALSGIFNSRRVNASAAPIFIGLLPGAASAFIAGDLVKSATGDYLDRDEQAFVTSYYRHIPESCLPTYSSIVLALSLSGVATGSFLLAMIPPVILLIALGYVFYLRKVPKDTGVPPAEHKGREWGKLFSSLWPLALAIALVILVPCIPFSSLSFLPEPAAEFLSDFPVWLAVLISIVLYFFISRFRWKEIAPFFRSSFRPRIMLNILSVMVFKAVLTESGVITELTDLLSGLPIPAFLVFALIFLLGTIVSGSTAIISLCTAPAFAAIPGGGAPLLMLLMCFTYAAMQVSPTHLCLTLIAEYFGSNLVSLVKKTLPVILVFLPCVLGYYLLLTALL